MFASRGSGVTPRPTGSSSSPAESRPPPITNRTAAYYPTDDNWVELAPAGRPVYRAAGACGFYKIGGTSRSPLQGAERHSGLDDCVPGPADVPWLDVAPLATTLAPGEGVTVTVSLDTGVEQPGTYQAEVRIGHDTPYPTSPVSVTLRPREPVSCDRTVTHVHFGRLRVTTDVTCVAHNARVTGPTSVRDGASLVVGDATLVGPVTATAAEVVERVGSRVVGPVRVRGTTGNVLLSEVRVTGPVSLRDNATGDLPATVAGNTVIGPLTCAGNRPAPVDEGAPSVVFGPKRGQCAKL